MAIYEHKRWLDKAKNVRVFGSMDEDELNISPMAKVSAIATGYFPQFEKQVADLDLAADKYELWMMEARQRRIHKVENYSDGHQDPYRGYIQALNTLVKASKKFAADELQ